MTGDKKKLLFLVPAFPGGVGGAERVITTLLRHLDRGRFDCHLALAQSGNAYLENVPEWVSLHQIRASRMRYTLPGIIRLVRKLRPQTILSTVGYLNVMLIAAKPFLPRGVRIILREATTPSAFIAKETAHPRQWTWFYRHFYPRAHKIICLSDSIMEEMAIRFAIPRQKLIRIYNPVDITILRLRADTQANPYKESGPHLVAAGRLRSEKGFDLLLEAMPTIIRRHPVVKLAVLGEGPDEADLREQAVRLGIREHVDFLGFKDPPWPYFRHADLLVMPSRHEGMPNAVLEALALGTRVVATDCPGGIREIAQTGAQIMLVAPESPEALAEGILAALQRGKEQAPVGMAWLKEFEVEHIAAEYSRLF
ncbi:MAG TPA: glycosyltransferase [Candidatus Angelobacter sp.]|nr:glycosyltransferase [Candidatus Angelobacter sp.]